MVLALGLAGCNQVATTRSLPLDVPPRAASAGPAAAAAAGDPATGDEAMQSLAARAKAEGWGVAEVIVRVPETLRVSEAANEYIPNADIVWREDPLGDRREQIARILREAAGIGLERLDGPRKVRIELIVRRFHALTELARYTVGGFHTIYFDILVRDAESGALIAGPEPVRMRFIAYGGARAVMAERRGLTQRVRIERHVAAALAERFGV